MSQFIRHPSGAAMRKDPETGEVWPETQSDEQCIISWESNEMSQRVFERWNNKDYLSDALCDITESQRIDDLLDALVAQDHGKIGQIISLIINDDFSAQVAKELNLC